MEDSLEPLSGDGDGHEDTAGEEDIVKGVEEVRKQMMMNLSNHAHKLRAICHPVFKCLANTLDNTEKKEEKIKYCKGDEKTVEDCLELSPPQDTYCQNISTHPQCCQPYGGIASHQHLYVAKQSIASLWLNTAVAKWHAHIGWV
eukprot:TRINITY_DN13550_c0_g1_i1.p2 TRINITY_DN13550_c0_g1~~TRINITY_DN13550_c0_g1_i1.p2  ORF type:complete len:144 (-),score=40.19 TRINITY_DN13550_c0_g1_i1:103-534(-)